MAKKRGNGEGSIYQRDDGFWIGQMTIGHTGSGQQRRKTFSGKTRREVAERMKTFQSEQQKGLLVEANKITLSDFIDYWLKIKQHSIKTSTYRSYVDTCNNHIKPILGSLKLQTLKTSQLETLFGTKHSEGLSPATIIRMRAIISGILNQAVKENVLPFNVSANCTTIKKDSPEISVLSELEMKQLLTEAKSLYEAKGNKFNFLYHAVLLALATGMRRGEILALKWDNINFIENTIAVKQNLVQIKGGIKFEDPKTKASKRVIAVAQNIMDEIKVLQSDNEMVFNTGNGTPINPSNLSRAFRLLLKRVGLSGIRFHDLRHTHATYLIMKGINVKQVSVRLGHEDIRITLDIYTHFMPVQDREAGNLMGELLL